MDLNTAQQHLNTELSEVLEHHEVVIECRIAAIMNSSGTLCRSIASLRSAFQHCFAVFKK